MIEEAENLLAAIDEDKAEKKACAQKEAEEQFEIASQQFERLDLVTAAQSVEEVSRNHQLGIEVTASLDIGQSLEIGKSVDLANSVEDDQLRLSEDADDDTNQQPIDENGDPLPTMLKVQRSVLDADDPNLNGMLDLIIERDEDKRLRKMRYRQTKEERLQLQSNVFDETLKRLTECVKGKFEATFGEEDMKRKPSYNLNYCMGPPKELQQQYNKLVDDAQYEVNNLHQMIDSKKLDIAKLMNENNKYLAAAGAKRSWKQYEKTLAVERVMNDRLINQLVKHRTINDLVTEG